MPARYRVNFTKKAALDLEEIYDYIRRDSPQNAVSIAHRLVDAIDSLEQLPHRFKVHL